MTEEDIIRIAREAGLVMYDYTDPSLERFANLLAAAIMPKEALSEMFEWGKDVGRNEEREACIKLIEDFSKTTMVPVKDTWVMGLIAGANALRTRGR